MNFLNVYWSTYWAVVGEWSEAWRRWMAMFALPEQTRDADGPQLEARSAVGRMGDSVDAHEHRVPPEQVSGENVGGGERGWTTGTQA